jgi:hypothetical protein
MTANFWIEEPHATPELSPRRHSVFHLNLPFLHFAAVGARGNAPKVVNPKLWETLFNFNYYHRRVHISIQRQTFVFDAELS